LIAAHGDCNGNGATATGKWGNGDGNESITTGQWQQQLQWHWGRSNRRQWQWGNGNDRLFPLQ
jgi:hypothetical protein